MNQRPFNGPLVLPVTPSKMVATLASFVEDETTIENKGMTIIMGSNPIPPYVKDEHDNLSKLIERVRKTKTVNHIEIDGKGRF